MKKKIHTQKYWYPIPLGTHLSIREHQCLFNTPEIFLVCFPLPSIHSYAPGCNSGGSVILRAKYVATGPLYFRPWNVNIDIDNILNSINKLSCKQYRVKQVDLIELKMSIKYNKNIAYRRLKHIQWTNKGGTLFYSSRNLVCAYPVPAEFRLEQQSVQSYVNNRQCELPWEFSGPHIYDVGPLGRASRFRPLRLSCGPILRAWYRLKQTQ